MGKKAAVKKSEAKSKPTCGIVMPISSIGDYSEQHWADIREILEDSITSVGFETKLVSDADDVGVIHQRIIQNLYENEMVVCDVSGKNPNVMFELGIRLAFDKPTIIVKDDKTSYSFDTSPIEHVPYRRDLRHAQTVEFKEKLAEKVHNTHHAATKDPDNFTTFLKHFGPLKAVNLETEEVSGSEFFLSELRDIRRLLSRREHAALVGNIGEVQRAMQVSELPGIVSSAVARHGREVAASLGLETKPEMVESLDQWVAMTLESLKAESIRTGTGRVKPILLALADTAPLF